jgi:hypothetical protein
LLDGCLLDGIKHSPLKPTGSHCIGRSGSVELRN